MGWKKQAWSQMYPPPPVFTEKECPDLTGKVFIVTGGYSGVGFELVKLLHQKNGTIYVAGRSEKKSLDAIAEAKEACPSSKGHLEFLFLDLGDLTTIKNSAESFLAKEDRLDVLWNNAGVMVPPKGSKTQQGYELQLGTNCLGPFLFTHRLLPILKRTATTSPPASIRVCWTGSLTAELHPPKGLINFDDLNFEKGGAQNVAYGQSKVGNILIGHEFAKRTENDGILSVTVNPGNLKSPLQRNLSSVESAFAGWMLHPPILGGYSELYAGISPDITHAHNGRYIIPWGRVAELKPDIAAALKRDGDGERGMSTAERFYGWCEGETKRYL